MHLSVGVDVKDIATIASGDDREKTTFAPQKRRT